MRFDEQPPQISTSRSILIFTHRRTLSNSRKKNCRAMLIWMSSGDRPIHNFPNFIEFSENSRDLLLLSYQKNVKAIKVLLVILPFCPWLSIQIKLQISFPDEFCAFFELLKIQLGNQLTKNRLRNRFF